MVIRAIEERLAQSKEKSAPSSDAGEGGKSGKMPVPVSLHRQLATRVRSWLEVVSRLTFDFNYHEVAAELSTLLHDPDDLEVAAENLEALAESLRKIRARRK